MKSSVIDLSHWDPADDYAAVKNAGVVGVIYKATQGSNYHDPTYASQRGEAKAAGLKWGAYHFGDVTNTQAQIDNFLGFARVEQDELFCLDWEDNPGGTMTAEQAKAFMDGCETRLRRPVQCVLYSGNRAKDVLGHSIDPFLGKRRLWLAQYGSTPSVQASWDSYWLWQFTDGQVGPEPHSVPGVGHCDISQYEGSNDQLQAEWASGTSAEPAPQVATVTIIAPSNVKIIVKQQEA